MTTPLNTDDQDIMEDVVHCTHPQSEEISNEALSIEGIEGIDKPPSVLINELRGKKWGQCHHGTSEYKFFTEQI